MSGNGHQASEPECFLALSFLCCPLGPPFSSQQYIRKLRAVSSRDTVPGAGGSVRPRLVHPESEHRRKARPVSYTAWTGILSRLFSDFRSSSMETNREGQRMTGPVACRKSAGRSWMGRTPRGQRWPSGWPGGPGRSACGPAPDSWRPAWVSSRGPSRAPGVRV